MQPFYPLLSPSNLQYLLTSCKIDHPTTIVPLMVSMHRNKGGLWCSTHSLGAAMHIRIDNSTI